MKRNLFVISTLFLVFITGYFVFSLNNQYDDGSISVNGNVYDNEALETTDGPSIDNTIIEENDSTLVTFFNSYKDYFISSKSILTYNGYAEYGYTLSDLTIDKTNLVIKYSGKMSDGYGEDSRGERTFSLNYIFKLDEGDIPMVYERVYNNDYMSSNTDSLNSIIKNYIVMWGDPKENDTWTQKVIYEGKEYKATTVMTNVSYTEYTLTTTIEDIHGFYNNTYTEKRTYDRGYGLISFKNTPSIEDDETSMDLIFGYTLTK
ncbi:MAG: hypothetical protein Q4B63_04435 [Clostridium perfringens]|nr:hypothetical protein [Clostridium perfringens]